MSGDVHVDVVGLTDVGRTREHNEDTFLVADLSGSEPDGPGAARHVVGPSGLVLLVADGMGGAAAGEIASRMAADEVHRFLVRKPLHTAPSDDLAVAQHVREAVEHANTVIHQYSVDHPDLHGMGTTVTVAVLLQERLMLAQIGDSRAYLIRDGVATQLTKDQSLTQRLVDAGELTEEQAERSERRNIILQALGPDARVKVALSQQPLRRDDALLICSDGLSGLVKREEIGTIVAATPSLQLACERLVALANERGGPDNVTVVVARFGGEGLPTDAVLEVGVHRLLDDEEAPDLPVRVPEAGYRTSELPVVAIPQARPFGMWVALVLGLIAAAVWVFLG